MKKNKVERIITIASIFFVLLIWFLSTNLNWVSPLFVPSPQRVLRVFRDIMVNGYQGTPFAMHLLSSMRRLLVACFIAIASGVTLGLASGYNHKLKAFVEPIIGFYRPLPPLAYYTLLILWMGIGDPSKIMLLFLAAFAPIYLSCVSAVLNMKQDYINSAYMLGTSKVQVFFKVLFPACLPGIFTGIRTGVGASYTTLVAAEMVAAISGIGWMTLDASRFLRHDIVFFGIIVMGITGAALDFLLKYVESKIVPWKGRE